MDTVAQECKKRKHHPEWTNIYNRTHVRWTTHNPEGLSAKDVEMATFCDRVGAEKGEVDAGPERMGEKGGDGFVDEARECCGGKS
jgi:4a-hydroxytetrahydrobiopterin dehydratase